MKRPVLFLSLSLLAVALSACGSSQGELESYVADVKARKTRQIEPIPQIKQYEAFTYIDKDRRDPFVRAEPERDPNDSANSIRPDPNRNPEPLEEFPIDGLRMVGTIIKDKTTYALVKAPDKVVHRVTIGNHMGQNYGKIVKIIDTQIDLIEIVPDGFGGFSERPANLALTP
jgi:type IV pilus assembly protein PilP